jgi:uncharacterized membrane protein YphA (DoxX/SURF4 family)
MNLQKLFPAFPTGWPGFGLLLLRGFVAFTLVAQIAAHIRSAEFSFYDWLFAALILAGAGLLLLGFMTPVVSIVVAVAGVAAAFTNPELIGVIVLGLAIAFLGPGAFSIDARMFGRREILIPKNSTESR